MGVLVKAFDSVSRCGLYCSIQSFLESAKNTIYYSGSTSEAFEIRCSIKKGYVLVLTLFGSFLLLRQGFRSPAEAIYLHLRYVGNYSPSDLESKQKSDKFSSETCCLLTM